MSVAARDFHRDSGRSRLRLVVCLLLACVLAWQILTVIAASSAANLMFDGAMNLGTSRSIADGQGPRWLYDTRDLFPAGVQTKEPFVFVGAAVFKLFGVGPWQAQLPNVLYFLLTAAVMLVLVRKVADTATALAAAVLALSAPLMTQYALDGYGEIPTLFFGLASLAAVAWPGRFVRHVGRWALFAGVLAGLAMATKVIGIVQVAVVGIVLVVRLWVEAEHRARPLLRACAAFAAGVALPLLLVECWRGYWLGADGYREWWRFQWTSILSQSGATPLAAQSGASAKIPHHFALLASQLRRTRLATAALMLLPLLGLALAWHAAPPTQRLRMRWVLLGLLVLVALYFPWWLAIVPTQKAWLRYLYIGLMALALLAGIGAAGNLAAAFGTRSHARRALHAGVAIAICALYWPFVAKSVSTDLAFGPNEDVQASQYAAGLISRLPADAHLFGFGWYAAPTVQLYTDRGFNDLTDFPIGRVVGHPAYLVADRATLVTGVLQRVLDRYPSRPLMRSNPFAQVYAVDFDHPNDPFAAMDTATVASSVDFAKDAYPLTSGYEPYDPMGGRFVESDSEILLRYDGQPRLDLWAYMALPMYYRGAQPLSGRVVVDGCPPVPFAFQGSGWQQFQLALGCQPATGSNVRVRLLLDNVFDLPQLYDRQRAMLVRSIGFGG